MIIKFQGALLQPQGVKFAVIVVKNSVIDSPSLSEDIQASYEWLFGGEPVVLAAQDLRGNFRYRGRTDLAKFLAASDPAEIPWKEYTYTLPDNSF